MEHNEGDKQCEVNASCRKLLPEQFYKIYETIIETNSGIMTDSFKMCEQPCYKVKVNLEVTWHIQSWKGGDAWLQIYDNTKTVPVHKAVFSFDIFSLTVELGSALGLWLGKDYYHRLAILSNYMTFVVSYFIKLNLNCIIHLKKNSKDRNIQFKI